MINSRVILQKSFDRLSGNRGFTLVEAIVTIVIFSFIVGGIFATMVAGDNSWTLNSIQIELQQELRKAMNRMKDDLQQTGRSGITDVPSDGAWYDTITFYKTDGVSGGRISWDSDTTQFALGGSGGDQLLRTSGGTTKVVAHDLQSVEFRRLSTAPSIVEVTMQAQKSGLKSGGTVSDSLDFKVHLRN